LEVTAIKTVAYMVAEIKRKIFRWLYFACWYICWLFWSGSESFCFSGTAEILFRTSKVDLFMWGKNLSGDLCLMGGWRRL